MVGHRFLAKSKPDGYTIGSLTTGAFTLGPALQDLDFDPCTAFTSIIQYATADHTLSVRNDSPIKSFKDFIEEGRKRELLIAGTGMTLGDLATERLGAEAKIKLKVVPYGGFAKSLPVVLGGHADAVVSAGHYEYVKAGQLRIIAQMTAKRNKEFPEIPTLKELGYDIEVLAVYSIAAPNGVPKPIQKKLEEAFTRAFRDPSFEQTLHNVAYTPEYRNGEDLDKYYKDVYDKTQKEFKEMGLGKYGKQKK
jgi:tripartite-type tricarboxylate transporter receptor subunit TctC